MTTKNVEVKELENMLFRVLSDAECHAPILFSFAFPQAIAEWYRHEKAIRRNARK